MKRKICFMWAMLLACLTINLSSCGNDEPSTGVVGTWKCVDIYKLSNTIDKWFLQLDKENNVKSVICYNDGRKYVTRFKWVKDGDQFKFVIYDDASYAVFTIEEVTSRRMTLAFVGVESETTVVFERMNDPQFAQQLRDMEETEIDR